MPAKSPTVVRRSTATAQPKKEVATNGNATDTKMANAKTTAKLEAAAEKEMKAPRRRTCRRMSVGCCLRLLPRPARNVENVRLTGLSTIDSNGDRLLTSKTSSSSHSSSKISVATTEKDNDSQSDLDGSFSNGSASPAVNSATNLAPSKTQSEKKPNKICDFLLSKLTNGHREEPKTSPLPNKLRLLDEHMKRTRSLAGPSPNCRFGPKAQLFQPAAEDTDQLDVSAASSFNYHDPGNTRLNWYTLPQSVLVIKKARDHDVLEPFVQLIRCLLRKGMQVFVEESVLTEEISQKCEVFIKMKDQLCTFVQGCDGLNEKIDFIVCLGGDGTLLYAGSLFQTSVPPVMAFHLGSLGFLTPFEFVDVETKIDSVLSGHANLTLRSRLKCVIRSKEAASHVLKSADAAGGATVAGSGDTVAMRNGFRNEDATHVVLNDVVIDRGPSPYLVHIDLFADGQLVTSVQGDGLIISTPTGSTAYAVAAGASIIHPGVPAIMITPICPHSLSFRPIVVPAGCDLRVMVSENARDSAWVSFDGRNRQQLSIGDSLRITTSVYPLPSICAADQMQDWFNGLAGCLHWNVRKPQKKLDPDL
ncbi:NAD kinase [Hypsibius exemplaris]|uniref:NAD(+) kinase n=1 Tax=Hypsibius exemplaris TaxID=2072580 RepID=A0A1W0WBM5_HYPEX|nr:NAD kinase [Hypsibius exemplaris]